MFGERWIQNGAEAGTSETAREPSERGLVELRPFGPSQSRGGKARGRKLGKT